MLFNKNLRHLLEIIIFIKNSNFNEVKKYINISSRTFYRWVEDINYFLEKNKLEEIKINTNLNEERVNLINNFLIQQSKKKNLELTNLEISLLIAIDIFKNNFYKISWYKKEYNITQHDWKIIENLITRFLEKDFEIGKTQFDKESFCSFLLNWFINYFHTKNIFLILLTQKLNIYFPLKIEQAIDSLINFNFYQKILFMLSSFENKNLIIRDWFYLSLYVYCWSLFDQRNQLETKIEKMKFPNKVRSVINILLDNKINNISFEKIEQKVKNVINKINPKIIVNSELIEIIVFHLSKNENFDFIDETNLNIYKKIKQDYPLMSELVIKEFGDFINLEACNDYYLLIYFLNFFRSYLTEKNLKILTICWGGMGMSQILKTNIAKTLSNSEISACPLIELKQIIETNDYDLIFSTLTFDGLNDFSNLIFVDNKNIISNKIFNDEVWKKIYYLLIQKNS